jgi:phenylalanyl-tRNA synthetase alpha chain
MVDTHTAASVEEQLQQLVLTHLDTDTVIEDTDSMVNEHHSA